MSKESKTAVPRGMHKYSNGIWHTRLFVDGREVRQSTGTSDRTLAKKILDKRRTAIAERRHMDVKKAEKTTTFHELCNQYTEVRVQHMRTSGAKSMVELWKKGLGNVPVKDMTSATIEKYFNERMIKALEKGSKTRFKASTRNRNIAMLKALFSWGMKQAKLIDHNPLQGVGKLREEGQRTRVLTQDEIGRLMNDPKTPEYLKDLMLTAMHSGLRRSELIALRWDAVDLTNRVITVRMAKSGKGRPVGIDNTLLELLTRLKPLRDAINSPWVFTHERVGKRGQVILKGQPITDFNHAFREAADRAKLTDVRFHDLRHTFASHLTREGVDIRTVQELLGHQSLAMTTRYTHVAPERRTQAVNLLDKALAVPAPAVPSVAPVAAEGAAPSQTSRGSSHEDSQRGPTVMKTGTPQRGLSVSV